MRVAVLAGGRSSEHEVSLASGQSIAGGLADAGHEPVRIVLERDGTWRGPDGEQVALHPGRGLLDCDAAFPALHGPFGEDGTVQGLLELLDVPYVGAGVAASAVCMDKLLFKELMAAARVPQVAYVGFDAQRWAQERDDVRERIAGLGFPCWVKPARLGSSVGIVRVGGPDDVDVAVMQALGHDPRVIVEATATGLEVECSVLGRATGAEASEPGEIVLLRGEGWYDYEAKYTPGGMELCIPARVPPGSRAKVRRMAVDAFRHVGCDGLARADFFVDPEAGTVLLNELNTMPGFTETSVYGKLWTASGLPYPELCDRLVRLAVERFEEERRYRF